MFHRRRLPHLLLLSIIAPGVHAEPQPTAAMFAPVNALVAFMSTLPAGRHAAFAPRGLCIVENFAPFLFCGAHAAADWEAGFRAHVSGLTDLKATFGAARDFSESGRRAYFSLPTVWTGRTRGKPFEEHGAWSFVLERRGAAAWNIVAYGWGVTDYTEAP